MALARNAQFKYATRSPSVKAGKVHRRACPSRAKHVDDLTKQSENAILNKTRRAPETSVHRVADAVAVI